MSKKKFPSHEAAENAKGQDEQVRWDPVDGFNTAQVQEFVPMRFRVLSKDLWDRIPAPDKLALLSQQGHPPVDLFFAHLYTREEVELGCPEIIELLAFLNATPSTGINSAAVSAILSAP